MELEKHITDERTGISYTLCGDYYLPDLKLPEEKSYDLGRFGKAKLRHLRKCHRALLTSLRTLPLIPFVKERILALKKEQENNRRRCGRSYHKPYAGYVCINEMGDLIKPHYVTEQFPKLLDANGPRRIRFHDLRHSCALLMLANGVPMKQIQDWLGHSNFSTTANIYAHLDYSTKLSSADAMLSGLGFQTEKA